MSSYDALLKTLLRDYKNPEPTKRDIQGALGTFNDLRPTKDPFVHNDGRQEDLVNLNGTIPVKYKGNTYNIPICVYLTKDHPYRSPIGFVKPTSSMSIKSSKHVDTSGRIYLPYLHEWNGNSSDLTGMITILTIVFSEESPVFAKTPMSNASALPYSTGINMPMPGGNVSYRPPQMQSTSQSYVQQQGYQGVQTGLTEDEIKASLRSAVDDKLKRKVGDILAQTDAEISALKRTRDELNQNKDKLNKMLDNIKNETDNVLQATKVIQEKNEEITKAINQLNQRDKVDIESLIVPSAPLYKQLFNAFAEEQAIEDAIYLLGEALRKNVIDFDTFFPQVRELARRQFELRATIQKCRQVAKLPELTA